ncbi:hypothetical protein PSCICO_22790 [Pseudomonas cichorii]|uniref:hypothetical protein n=1 Tax=Pseudomonas cichorii TaxID=36746 RepID=UPI00190FFD0F|nr:hypothetical protein [Pseudomonas cichorii]GFM86880.1 hypothetical protein PSCICO_22790 [Pseudomonas cichorii]
MQIQKIQDDIGEHRKLFVRLPFARLFRKREYAVTSGYLLIISIFMLYRIGSDGVDGFVDTIAWMSYCMAVLMIALMRCVDVIAITRSDVIERVAGIARPQDCTMHIGLQVQEQQWFRQRYQCANEQLANEALALEEQWCSWQRICSKAGDDQASDFKRFYFSFPESGRFMTLLVGFFAIVATLIITLGATPTAYFELVDDWRGYVRLVIQVTMLLAYAALPLLGAKVMLKEMFLTLLDYINAMQVTDRSFYRYIRQMIWSAGVRPGPPRSRGKVPVAVDRALAFFSLSPFAALRASSHFPGWYIRKVPFVLNFVFGFMVLWLCS